MSRIANEITEIVRKDDSFVAVLKIMLRYAVIFALECGV